MVKDQELKDGRVPDGTGLSSDDGAPTGLHPSGFDPSRVEVVCDALIGFLRKEDPKDERLQKDWRTYPDADRLRAMALHILTHLSPAGGEA